jgi:hypothetical protein
MVVAVRYVLCAADFAAGSRSCTQPGQRVDGDTFQANVVTTAMHHVDHTLASGSRPVRYGSHAPYVVVAVRYALCAVDSVAGWRWWCERSKLPKRSVNGGASFGI